MIISVFHQYRSAPTCRVLPGLIFVRLHLSLHHILSKIVSEDLRIFDYLGDELRVGQDSSINIVYLFLISKAFKEFLISSRKSEDISAPPVVGGYLKSALGS